MANVDVLGLKLGRHLLYALFETCFVSFGLEKIFLM